MRFLYLAVLLVVLAFLTTQVSGSEAMDRSPWPIVIAEFATLLLAWLGWCITRGLG